MAPVAPLLVALAEPGTDTEQLQPAIGLSRGALLTEAGVARRWSPLLVALTPVSGIPPEISSRMFVVGTRVSEI